MMRDQSVLISGAGIAGPTVAYWLACCGFKPVLVERAPRLREGGYVIDFWGLGYDTTERMGLLHDLKRRAYRGGYDWQQRYFVYGVAADWTWTNLSHTVVAPGSSLDFFRAKVDWLASFRTRAGLAIDDTLVYITGGLALGDIKSGAGEAKGSYIYDTAVSKVRTGWVAGLGVEHRFAQNLSVFSEFLYYDLQRVSATAISSPTHYTYTSQFSHEAFVSRLGINWRF
jgi:opacity protein-like surface antigen